MAALAVVGCGGGGEQVNEAAEAEFAWLTETSESLSAMRQELAELRAEAAMMPEEGEEEGEPEAEGEGEEGPGLEEQIRAKEQEVIALSDEFVQRVVGYLNDLDPMLEGEEPNERQLAVIRMKSSEDIVTAREYIERGGDYRRAITIYQDAMNLDPDNPQLAAALARAEEMRFMTEERLATVKKGMTEDEVKELLGPVNLRNIREYPERNVVAWFYPVDDSGAASAVWFRKGRDGEYSVYKTAFDQVKGRGEEVEPEDIDG